mgnify:CR=1 FL=1
MEHRTEKLTRRRFLRAALTLGAGVIAASCTPTPTPTSQPKPTAARQLTAGPAPPTPTAPPPPTAAPKAVVKVRWWGGVPEANGPKQAVEAWNKAHPEIQVEYVQYTNTPEGNVKLDTALMVTGEVDVCSNYGLTLLKKRADGGQIEPLDAYLGSFNPEKEFGKTANQWDGKTWALYPYGQPFFIFVNKKVLDEAGLQVPTDWTWDEFRATAKKLVQGSGPQKRWGVILPSFTWAEGPAVYQGGGDFAYKDKCTTNYDHPLWLKSISARYLLQYVDKIEVTMPEYKAGKLVLQNEFYQGRAAMMLGGAWLLRYIKDLQALPRDWLTTFAPIPYFPDHPRPYRTGEVSESAALAKSSKDKQAAWEFLKWFCTEGYLHMNKHGRLALWKGLSADQKANAFLEGFDAARYMDVDAFKRVVLAAEKDFPIQTITTGAAELGALMDEEVGKLLSDAQKPEQTAANLKKRGDEILSKLCK